MSGRSRTNPIPIRDTRGATWYLQVIDWDGGRCTVEILTPDDPDHWAYGENGPIFDAAEFDAVYKEAQP
ncbi:MAG TPA: hypothetical protein VM328_10935 [Fimbriimonadaceae bacterium]|nr:hypothetical protein [Fimbriimonadaceae bacterium]